jgi:aryl-alcohol dehydrogenase-like predicted oxidoreductase
MNNHHPALGRGTLGLGAMYLGTKLDRDASFALLDRFVDAGHNLIDTSNNYAFWVEGGTGDESETVVGQWMRSRGNRADVVVATKVGARPRTAGGGLDAGEGLSARAIEAAVDQSLRRLQTDRIDLYYAHVPDRTVALEETLAAFDALVKKGKVGALGCNNHRAFEIERARGVSRRLGTTPYTVVQQRHTFLRPKPFAEFVGGVQVPANEDLLRYCEGEADLGLVAYSPLLGGLYNRQPAVLPPEYDTPDNRDDLARLQRVARERGVTPNQLVLAWMIRGRNRIVPLVAASTRAQLDENLGAANVALSADEVRAIGWWG